ncbi:MAG: Cys-tRNA(Pro) deacylase [Muribaculaceae bacterium]|nr:Cys-tRNA(Pro) deacylase [Muribaculaceae bacterium]
MKINKTNAARLLDRAHITYELIPYEVDENNLAATHVAESLGEDISLVFKTIVLTAGPGQFFVCVVPGDAEIDLKKAARAAGAKKAELLPMKELLPLTGYIRGGCSPVGMKKQFPTFFHSTAPEHEYIYVSAGMRGLQFKVKPADIIGFVNGNVADLIADR